MSETNQNLSIEERIAAEMQQFNQLSGQAITTASQDLMRRTNALTNLCLYTIQKQAEVIAHYRIIHEHVLNSSLTEQIFERETTAIANIEKETVADVQRIQDQLKAQAQPG